MRMKQLLLVFGGSEECMHVFRLARRRIRAFFRRDIWFPESQVGSVEWLGNREAWFPICTSQISRESTILSFGVGAGISYDLALFERFGVTVHAFDPTPQSCMWLPNPKLPSQFRSYPIGFPGFEGLATMVRTINTGSSRIPEAAESTNEHLQVPMKTLETICRELDIDGQSISKLDIDGWEYSVLDSLLDSAYRLHQILVEFHHHFHPSGTRATRDIVQRLFVAGYVLSAVSAIGEEFGFLRSDLLSSGHIMIMTSAPWS